MDPLSPYLFILCTEVLIANLRTAEATGLLSGVRLAPTSPPLSHLLFADDSLFFCKATPQQCDSILNVLQSYGNASGQCINFDKSAVTFGKDVPEATRAELKRKLQIPTEGGSGKYLGIPEQLQGSKAEVFAYVQERFNQRTNGWSAKLLSRGGKEVMIKSVAQAVPTFVMLSFLLPKRIHRKLASATAKFWWSNKQNSGGMHWIAWKKMCLPKSEGGIGFKSFEEFNQALLANQLWRVLKGRYYRYAHPFEAKKGNRPSYGWQSLWSAIPLVKKGMRRTIGNGASTWVWSDNWIPDKYPRPARGVGPHQNPNLRVVDLIHETSDTWNVERIRQLIAPADIPLILAMCPSRVGTADGFCWHFTNTGLYTVRSGYELARRDRDPDIKFSLQLPSLNPLKAKVWKVKTTNKIRHFLWQALSGAVSVNERLAHRHLQRNRQCPRCGAGEETINHTLFTCPPARQCWALAQFPQDPSIFPTENLWRNMDFLLSRLPTDEAMEAHTRCYPWIIWYIWKARNEQVFQSYDRSPQDTADLANRESAAWFLANNIGSEAEQPNREENGEPLNRSIFTCYIDGSWKDGDPMSGIGWTSQLQDGDIDLLGCRALRCRPTPLHTELQSLLWAMESLRKKQRYCNTFVTDSKELTAMVREPEQWPRFKTELEELAELGAYFPRLHLTVQPKGDECSG